MCTEEMEIKARPVRYRPRRSTGDRVNVAVLALAGGHAQLLAHSEKPWASITFSGSRHELTLDFDGEEAIADGEAFIAALPDHEFTLPGKLVADACIQSVDHRMMPEPRMEVRVALLLLDDV